MKAKPDFSRLVMLDLSPTEAVILARLCEMCLEQAEKHGPEFVSAIGFFTSLVGRINLQLDQLHWPAERRRAPYPV
jgi:hypothetical protein